LDDSDGLEKVPLDTPAARVGNRQTTLLGFKGHSAMRDDRAGYGRETRSSTVNGLHESNRSKASGLRGAMLDVRRRVHAMEQVPEHVVHVTPDDDHHLHMFLGMPLSWAKNLFARTGAPVRGRDLGLRADASFNAQRTHRSGNRNLRTIFGHAQPRVTSHIKTQTPITRGADVDVSRHARARMHSSSAPSRNKRRSEGGEDVVIGGSQLPQTVRVA
jgi:hypothetical protein